MHNPASQCILRNESMARVTAQAARAVSARHVRLQRAFLRWVFDRKRVGAIARVTDPEIWSLLVRAFVELKAQVEEPSFYLGGRT